MPKVGCPHTQPNRFKDLLLVVAAVIGFLMLREVLSWMLKTNHTYGAAHRAELRVAELSEVLQRNGLR